MPSLSEYFEKERPKPIFDFGTRVFGKWNKIPFVGTVYGDGLISHDQGPRLTIHLDLPIVVDDIVRTVIIDTYANFSVLAELTDYDNPTKIKQTLVKINKPEKKAKPVEKSRSASLIENLKKLQGTNNVTNSKKSRKRTSR